MKLWLEFLDGECCFLHTTKPDATADVRLLEYNGEKQESLYIVHDNHQEYHLFGDLIDAIHFSIEKENRPQSVWRCWIDDFKDPDEISISHLTLIPIKYISCMEISYRMYNPRLTPIEAFHEAVAMWKLFGPENIKILRQLISRYPEYHTKTYAEHLRQHDLLIAPNQWTSLSEFMNSTYPSPRSSV